MPDDDGTVKGNPRAARRAQRRAEMVEAAMAAVRAHGAGVSVADMAASAGITKPVLYRHFDDRADLQRAVGKRAAENLMQKMAPALMEDLAPRAQIAAVVDAFLQGVEEEPELWRFVVHNPAPETTDVADDVRGQIATLLAQLIGGRLRAAGQDSGGAEAYAYGLVGMVESAGDWWLERRTMSRADLTGYLTTLIWNGAHGVLGTPDVESPVLRMVPKENPGVG
ncbi:TetR family transcriptional regulator [Pseudonocardia oroxyli]|uniref:Transcriptional regulator, TetR family n=1 Tax=Pseudonocardia oroxyli TaxID=366584 RepID=A0A1G7QPF9_PSEOR|nr:TetR family transcriptional regulator [Pseudonocardia oroxyli]SDG00405.1 transcriptional regulator, TetR family [Pseudonocardia oroxyli]